MRPWCHARPSRASRGLVVLFQKQGDVGESSLMLLYSIFEKPCAVSGAKIRHREELPTTPEFRRKNTIFARQTNCHPDAQRKDLRLFPGVPEWRNFRIAHHTLGTPDWLVPAPTKNASFGKSALQTRTCSQPRSEGLNRRDRRQWLILPLPEVYLMS